VIDVTLLSVLPDVTRPNVLELSRRLGLARNTVQARLDRMSGAGLITAYEPVVDLRIVGYDVLAYTTLEIAQGAEAALLAGLAQIPEVLEVHKVTGPGDLVCRIVARTNPHLNEVLARVLALSGIRRTTTVLALSSPVSAVRPSVDAITALANDAYQQPWEDT
jgi:DNA-binding Lrp family transcriptional regulator